MSNFDVIRALIAAVQKETQWHSKPYEDVCKCQLCDSIPAAEQAVEDVEEMLARHEEVCDSSIFEIMDGKIREASRAAIEACAPYMLHLKTCRVAEWCDPEGDRNPCSCGFRALLEETDE